MNKEHNYTISLNWHSHPGTINYKDYARDHTVQVAGKPTINASSDPAFRGNAAYHNPEELFLSSIASCHMLWYLHLCAVNGVVVKAQGIMVEKEDGSGYFTKVILYPIVTVSSKEMEDKAKNLHEEANKFCFIANSLNFAVKHIATVIVK